MSKLGARKNRERDVWMLIPHAAVDSEECVYPEYSEEDSKLGCELGLLFMLMHIDPQKERGRWYHIATKEAWSHPSGSYRNVFFWSIRFLGERYTEKNEETGEMERKYMDLDEFRSYMSWKLEEFNSGRIRREGPVW
jgi:hypothetical protein